MTAGDRWMRVATEIATHLCDSAVVHDGRCTWLGTTQDEDADGELEFTYGTVGPDLYGGVAGIALFLAEVAARTGDARCRERAVQAIRQAIRGADRIPAGDRTGYFSGATGIAYAAARTGRALGESGITADASGLLVGADEIGTPRSDIISGAAGAIPALLTLSAWLGRVDLHERAVALGDRVISAARPHESNAWSWRDDDSHADTAPDLTGFSHGAAGIGWALLELHADTGEARFHDAAERAFRYESHWFRPGEDNWPDFRDVTTPDEPADCGVAWCHGAPGIGLSRLRAIEPSPGGLARRDVAAAVRTSIRFVERASVDGDADWSPCHGAAGVCDFLVQASDALAMPGARDAAIHAASVAAQRFAGEPGRWPCGVARGSNPSLMLGLAGIGYFFLRLADETLPSALLPGARGNGRTAESKK